MPNIYDVLFEQLNDNNTSDIDLLIQKIPFIEKLPVNDILILTTCSICKFNNCSIKLKCAHSFCQDCIIIQLMTTYDKFKKEMCPYCRTEFHYLTK